MSLDSSFDLKPIGYVKSPFKQKFGLPRQANLIEHRCRLKIIPPFNDINAFRGLSEFSHIWVIYLFDQNRETSWRPLIRPPRLGGNDKIGVFASRSSFRPNNLAMSVVELFDIKQNGAEILLETSMIDAVDGTPFVDIKPYVQYSDRIDAKSSYAAQEPEQTLSVQFSDQSIAEISAAESNYPGLMSLVEQTLALDPRPAFKGGADSKTYRITIYDYDLEFQVEGDEAKVIALLKKEH